MSDQVRFVLNGDDVTIDDPPPDLLLIDFLRSPGVGLTGAKKGCGQGGCGACTVILSSPGSVSGRVEHRAINSCLRPVCALGGLAVTTVEGTGAPTRLPPAHLAHQASYSRAAAPPGYELPGVTAAATAAGRSRDATLAATAGPAGTLAASGPPGGRTLDAGPPGGQAVGVPTEGAGVNEVAHRLALNNGTQCGYCTTGFVMNMSAFLAENPGPTKRQIEDIFDGNICRCTGYRAILTGMKTFACDWSAVDEANRMPCTPSADLAAQFHGCPVTIPLGVNSGPTHAAVSARRADTEWVTPATLSELLGVLRGNQHRDTRLVHGNTGFGVYPEEFLAAEVLVDLRLIGELSGISVQGSDLRVGAATTYSELIEALDKPVGAGPPAEGSRLAAVRLMAQRTAGTIVRNAATVAGNAMLVLTHIASGEPFPSDLLTALVGVDARVEFVHATSATTEVLGVGDLVAAVAADPSLLAGLVLLAFLVPLGDPDVDVVLAQKVATREVNAHSIVNATSRLEIATGTEVTAAVLTFGGLAPHPWRATRTEAALVGRSLSIAAIPELVQLLRTEVQVELRRWEGRLAGLPWEGITDVYRVDLAVTFLYKAVVNALLARDPAGVPEGVASSGRSTWGRWPVSDGRQSWAPLPWRAPVGAPHINIMALYQATGAVHYTHEFALPPTAVNGAFVQSRRALAEYHFVLPDGAEPISGGELAAYLRGRFDSFIELITYEHIPPHGLNLQGMGADQPLFALPRTAAAQGPTGVGYVGQVIALVIAATEAAAIEIAEFASAHCVGYEARGWAPPFDEPVLSLERAIEIGSVFPDCPASASFNTHIWRITRPGSSFDWATLDRDPLDRTITVRTGEVDTAACTVVGTTQRCGGQAHFYMETQAAVAVPMDGDRIFVGPSTQSPMEMHATTAMALGIQYHRIEVGVRQLGGAYGGKTEQARFVAGPAALAAYTLNRPVRLALKREHDTAMIGKRHAYYGAVQIAVDEGHTRPGDRGRIRGFLSSMWGDGGAFYDCSFIVSNCIQLRADNAYNVANFRNQIDVCRTNTAPSTAFRAFGDIQGKLLTENAIDDAAFALGMSAEAVREKNLYDRGDVTPFGQALSYCYLKDVWAYAKKVSDYDAQCAEVEEFNARNTWRKRGIAIVPVKYGSGYNLVQLEQSAASVAVNPGDGSIVIQQGGVEMGQGLFTVVEQVAAYVLGVPMDFIHVAHPDTSVLPAPTSTGASTGTPYAAHAVKGACQALRKRLLDFGYRMREQNGPAWCTSNGIDFWNHGETGWAATASNKRLVWQNLIAVAYQQRVSLLSGYSAPVRGGETPVPALTFKPMDEQPKVPGIPIDEAASPNGAVDSFSGFTYSAATSVVEVDVLTGEVKVLSADLVYDAGQSMNPAIDIGQVEGAFVQGVGYVLCEELVFQPDGDERGTLNTVNTWRYKPPATVTIPLRMNTYLFPRDSVDVPENPDEIYSAKEVGEPPLVLATSVFFAVKAAVRASRLERGLPGLFTMNAPATVQEIRRACAVDLDHHATP